MTLYAHCALCNNYISLYMFDPFNQFFCKVFVGDKLKISVRTVGAISGFTVVEGKVICNKKIIAAGKIKLWVPEPELSGVASG